MDKLYVIIHEKNSKRFINKNKNLLNHTPLIEHTLLFCNEMNFKIL